MVVNIRLFDNETIDELVWPDTEEASFAKCVLLPMIKEGVSAFIRNVDTQLYLLQVNAHLIPITVNQGEYNNSYVTSNYFPIKYLEERLHKNKPALYRLRKPLVKIMGGLLKALKINKTIIVNNWLLTTSLYPALSDEEWQTVTAFLTAHFPDHALMFRNLNDHAYQDLKQELNKQRYRFIYARHIYIYDPQEKSRFSSKVHYHHRRDRGLVKSQGYEIVYAHDLTLEDNRRLLQLYAEIYLNRHTCYSPQYNERYLNIASRADFLRLVCIKKENHIHGVIGFHQRGEKIIAPFLGYDEAYGQPNHLYRMLTMLAIDEAEKHEALLYDGSGGEEAKHRRGMKPFAEHLAIYDRHLPFYRRLFWGLAEKMVKGPSTKLIRFQNRSSHK